MRQKPTFASEPIGRAWRDRSSEPAAITFGKESVRRISES